MLRQLRETALPPMQRTVQVAYNCCGISRSDNDRCSCRRF